MLTLSAILALTDGLFGQPAFSQEVSPDPVPAGTGSFDQGPDGDPFGEVSEIRREVKSGEKIDSILSLRFDPLHKLWDPFVDKVRRNGLDITFQYTAMVQNSSDLIPGIENELPGAQNTLSGGDADLVVRWHACRPGKAYVGYFRLSAEHRHGYSKLPPAGMASQIGSLWPRHVDQTDDTTKANGFAINAEHQFGNWTPFFRYSFGDQDRSDSKSHPIRQSANIGIGYDGVFGQNKDWVAIVATWAEPTDETLRDQYGLEVDYSFRLTPHIFLTPHVQLIRDPSRNPSKKNISVIGLRSRIEF